MLKFLLEIIKSRMNFYLNPRDMATKKVKRKTYNERILMASLVLVFLTTK